MIRKTFLVLTILLLNAGVYAQEYHKLLRDDFTWDVWYSDTEKNPNCEVYDVKRYFIEGDTTISEKSYKKIGYYSFSPVNSEGPYCWPYQVNPGTGVLEGCFLREDTLNRKVYLIAPDYEEEILLYDFTLQVGDFTNDIPSYSGANEIDEIDSVQLSDGTYRTRFNLDNGFSYIEGIGSSAGLFEPLGMGISFWSTLRCVKHDGEALWGCDGSYDTYYIVGIEEEVIELSNTVLYPNPTSSLVSIDLKEMYSSVSIKVKNQLGITLKTLSYQNVALCELDLSFVENGIYYLEVALPNQDTKTLKVLKN